VDDGDYFLVEEPTEEMPPIEQPQDKELAALGVPQPIVGEDPSENRVTIQKTLTMTLRVVGTLPMFLAVGQSPTIFVTLGNASFIGDSMTSCTANLGSICSAFGMKAPTGAY
jgi:hypothetical protein